MSTYIIGDVQGCFNELLHLLDNINFNKNDDTLWFVGDLVNRGPDSYKVLSFIKELPNIKVVLGNHDLHLLAATFANKPLCEKDTIQDLLSHPDGIALCHFLRKQPFIHFDQKFNCILVHAGIPPMWNIEENIKYSNEMQETLSSNYSYIDFLNHLYGDLPNTWDPSLVGWDRSRMIINYFTRMRLCTMQGKLFFKDKVSHTLPSTEYLPWFKLPNQLPKKTRVFFGHWAALNGITNEPNYIALDTGCVWGNRLTAYRLDDNALFAVPSRYKFIDYS